MQKSLIAALGAAALFAVPAFAASTPSTETNPPGSTATAPAAGTTTPNASTPMPRAPGSSLGGMRQKITAELTKDGFKNVEVVADSFLVHAINQDGEPVVMIINPDSVFAVTKLTSAETGATPKAGATPESPATTKQ